MDHNTHYMTTGELIIELIVRFFTLAAGVLPLNVCKVMTVASAAGMFFCFACVEGPYTGRACLGMLVCLLLASFFGSCAYIIEDVVEWDPEEDEF